MNKKLSTNLTLFWKLFGILWVLFFLVSGMIRLFDWLSSPNTKIEFGGFLLFCIFALFSSVFVLYLTANLKVVKLAGDSLLVSDFRKQIVISFLEISHVDKPDNSSLRRIKIILKKPCEFGEEIVFAPCFFKAKETAELLKKRISTNYLSL